MVDAYTQLLGKSGLDLLNDYNLANKKMNNNASGKIFTEELNPTVFVYFDGKLRTLYSDLREINQKLSDVLPEKENVNFVVYTKVCRSFSRCPVEANDKLNKKGQRAYLKELADDGRINADIISGYSGVVEDDPVVASVPITVEKSDALDKKLHDVKMDGTEKKENDVFLGIPTMICPGGYTHNVLAIGYGGVYIPPKGTDVDYSKIIRDVFGQNHYLVKPLADNDTVAGKHMNNNFNDMVAAYNEKIPIIFNSR